MRTNVSWNFWPGCVEIVHKDQLLVLEAVPQQPSGNFLPYICHLPQGFAGCDQWAKTFFSPDLYLSRYLRDLIDSSTELVLGQVSFLCYLLLFVRTIGSGYECFFAHCCFALIFFVTLENINSFCFLCCSITDY